MSGVSEEEKQAEKEEKGAEEEAKQQPENTRQFDLSASKIDEEAKLNGQKTAISNRLVDYKNSFEIEKDILGGDQHNVMSPQFAAADVSEVSTRPADSHSI